MECFSNTANSTALPGRHLLLISSAPDGGCQTSLLGRREVGESVELARS